MLETGSEFAGKQQHHQISPQWNAQCDVERGGDRQLCDGAAGQIANPFLVSLLLAI